MILKIHFNNNTVESANFRHLIFLSLVLEIFAQGVFRLFLNKENQRKCLFCFPSRFLREARFYFFETLKICPVLKYFLSYQV